MLYCCKKCIDGVVKRYMSPNPCSEGGAVPCHQADPVCNGGGDGNEACIEGCEEERRQLQANNVAAEIVEQRYQECITRCGGNGNGNGDGNGGGDGDGDIYVPENQQCPEGYRDGGVTTVDDEEAIAECNRKYHEAIAAAAGDRGKIIIAKANLAACLQLASAGRRRCIRITNGNGDGNGDGDGDGCEGGYKLASNPLAAEGGSIWTDSLITEAMGFYRNPAHQAHYIHKGGKFYSLTAVHEAIEAGTTPTPLEATSACKKGYPAKTINGEQWCCPEAGGGGGGGAGGEFEWSEELMALLARLRERFQHLSDYPRGTTPEERQGIINYAMQGVKRGERGRLQSSQDQLSRMGLLGSGFELSEADKIKRATGETTSNIQSRVAIDELDRRFNELMGTTGAMGNIMSVLFSGEQMPEILSAARRGESQNAMAMLMNYLSTLMGGQTGSQYWPAILNQGSRQPQGSSIWDWLPWLGILGT